MDERQAQIREGAGLDEARLNVEFIDFLKKWSTPILVVIALIALAYFGVQKRREMKAAAHATAFMQLDAARESGSPAGLLSVAADHGGKGAVAEIARLAAADIYLASYRAGITPGGRVDATGKPEDEADLLSEEDRAKQLDRAAELYQQVVDDTTGQPDMAQHTVGALYGLAAVAECRGNFDAARAHYETIETIARNAGMPEHVEIAGRRLETLGTLASVPHLYARSEIPQSKAGSLPEGVVPIPNPFANQPQQPAPEGPTAPSLTPPAEEPAAPLPVVDPETALPGGVPPEPKSDEPTEKPTEAPTSEPKKDNGP